MSLNAAVGRTVVHGDWDGAANDACHFLRIATWNGRGLSGHLMDVVQIANRLGLDVLCSQEAGFSAVSEASCNVRLRPLGWTIIVNSESADLARSIAVLVRLRLSPRQIAYAKDCPQLAGAIFVRLQRAGAEPFNVVNIYAPIVQGSRR